MSGRARHLAATAVVCAAVTMACGGGAETPASGTIFDEPAAPPAEPPGRPVDNLPATFVGLLPCADCPGIDATLNLMPDQSYFLRLGYRERAVPPIDELGRWAVGSDGRTLLLRAAGGSGTYFEMIDRTTLRQLDADARPLPASVNRDLRREAAFRPLDVRAAMRGAYAYLADAASFTECSTGHRWPVATEGANADLELTYRRYRPGAPGEPLVVSVEARVEQRPRMEGDGTEAMLVVDRVNGAFPTGTCVAEAVTVSLEDTDWQLTEVRGEAVPEVEGRLQQPGLRLQSANGQFSGSGGCNRLLGGFRRDGAELAFSPSVTTRMACPAGMETEEALVAALEEVASWRILGRTLDLRDARGVVLARFEAR